MNKNAFSNILNAVNKMKEGAGFNNDKDKYWSCETDKAGNGQATIRFLPSKDGESLPFVRKYSHGFQVGAKWFIDDCRTTIGDNCPVCEANNDLWNTGVKENQEIVRKRKRKQSFIANILVVSDPKNPDNEGKVFMFKFGKKIFDKIVDKMQPEFEDEEAINPFDPAEGCDFKLKIRRVEGYANFDKSEFSEKKDRSDEIEAVENDIEDLQDLIAPEKFKSYADQKKRLDAVLGAVKGGNRSTVDEDDSIEEEDLAFLKNASKKTQRSEEVESEPAPSVSKKAPAPASSDDDDDMDFFRNLADED